MSVPERRAMVERPSENLSVRRQCVLLNLARSGVYRPVPVIGADDLALMRRLDELHLKWPFYGSRRAGGQVYPASHGKNPQIREKPARALVKEGVEPSPAPRPSAPRHQNSPSLHRGGGVPAPPMV